MIGDWFPPVTMETTRKRRIDALVGHLPRRLQPAVHWLRRPAVRWIRLPAGLLLILGGIFIMLPLIGLWMVPLGLILLGEDLPLAGRILDRVFDWLARRHPHWLDETPQ